MRRLGLIFSLVAVNGCATMFTGTKQTVLVESSPSAAKVVVKAASGLEVVRGTTPASLTLARKNEYIVEITAAGFQAQTIKITQDQNLMSFLNVFNLGIGLFVDQVTGALYSLSPARIRVTLQRGTGSGENDQSGVVYSRVQVFNDRGVLVSDRVQRLVPLQR